MTNVLSINKTIVRLDYKHLERPERVGCCPWRTAASGSWEHSPSLGFVISRGGTL